MSADLLLDVEAPMSLIYTAMEKKEPEEEMSDLSIDQDGEWDISLFDELGDLGDAEELLRALEATGYSNSAADLNFDVDLSVWNSDGWADASSVCTDGEASTDSLSPSHTISSVSSPASVEAHSPYSLQNEALSPLSPESQPSPLSVCSDSSGFVELPPEKKPCKKTSQTQRAKPAQPAKRPIHLSPKFSIQPKPVITAVPIPQATAPLQAKTIIIQPLQTTILPMVKPPPVTIQPAPPTGRPILLSQPTQVLQLQTPQAVSARTLTTPTVAQERPTNLSTPLVPPPVVTIPFQNAASDDDCSFSRRQQRMIKNRESASLSRKKKKEYLLTLEARLKVALSENEKLKSENGVLKRQLDGLMSENTVLKATAPKRRAVCLMVVLVFLFINISPLSLFDGGTGSRFETSPSPNNRRLLGFSSESDSGAGGSMPDSEPPHTTNRREHFDSVSEEKALMVVKREALFFRPPPPCQPTVNRTKCMKMASELKGWVHRHETERTKSTSTSTRNPRSRTIPKTGSKKVEVAQIATVQYSDSNEKRPGNELQVYYAPRRAYSDFFDEINRRGDTFYVVSFRRDHLLLPATHHNKGSRPKMTVVLPAMNINESVIEDREFEVMMQIDCEVMDTRILHIKSSSIPPVLRVNETETGSFYRSAPTNNQAKPPVVLMGSA
ncbi:cyclic AMP-dependent transcription factor ATF-6 alpha [Pygocentrus nattereri]|uniref:BZIP domain-containing protein n=1 Tax=Pygocentrus nattereri TaxID=42514 RepID=A0A3B4DJQ2_PYGNA|nr:cyclic AMP-dependent transcription factor ATF-6 alpha [Pygocentrus nattereri]